MDVIELLVKRDQVIRAILDCKSNLEKLEKLKKQIEAEIEKSKAVIKPV